MDYLPEIRHDIISNEWDSSSLEKLELSGRQLDGTTSTLTRNNNSTLIGPWLLFLTTLRDTLDCLLSVYTFFALTITKKKRKQKNKDGPTFSQWIEQPKCGSIYLHESYCIAVLQGKAIILASTRRKQVENSLRDCNTRDFPAWFDTSNGCHDERTWENGTCTITGMGSIRCKV